MIIVLTLSSRIIETVVEVKIVDLEGINAFSFVYHELKQHLLISELQKFNNIFF